MRTWLALFSLLSVYPLVAQEPKGHPLVEPYPGSKLLDTKKSDYEEIALPIGPVVKQKVSKSQLVAGRYTKLSYRDPEGRSAVEKFRNYEQALRGAGFEVVYSCNNELNPSECGSQISLGGAIPYWPTEKRYLAAKLARPAGNVWVAAAVGAAFTNIWIVEEKPMQGGLVKITAEALNRGILDAGHVAVYGVYFDTGKADIKPESADALKEITTLLQKNAGLKLHVVGHTDNAGALASNMDLSRRRAAAVVAELVSRYKIDAARLRADGVGPLAPVASNRSDEGKAKNRRVELVEQ